MNSFFAMDCEMVESYGRSILARVTIVDAYLHVVLDTYVYPVSEVTNYRYPYSGITEEDLRNGADFDYVRNMVARILRGKILVGHSLDFDLNVLQLAFPEQNVRDLAKMPDFLRPNGQPMSLKELARIHLGRSIQQGPHCSKEDAIAAMEIFLKVKRPADNDAGFCVIL